MAKSTAIAKKKKTENTSDGLLLLLERLIPDDALRAKITARGATFISQICEMGRANRDLMTSAVLMRHSHGVTVQLILETQENAGVALAAAALGMKGSELYSCCKVARAFDETEITALVARSGFNGFTAAWGHIDLLSGEADKTKRDRLTDLMFAEGWTYDVLSAHISARAGENRGKGSRGAAIKLPANILGCLSAFRSRVVNLTKFGGVAFSEGGLVAMLNSLDSEAVDPMLVGEFEATRESLDSLSDSVATMVSQFNGVEAQFKTKLARPALPPPTKAASTKAVASKPAGKKKKKVNRVRNLD